MSTEPRVYDGKEWTTVSETDGAASTGNASPLIPILDGDGKVFVSIPSYRDGKRCGQTIHNLFEQANDPDKVVVGVIEQSSEEDDFCIEEYCSLHGTTIFKRQTLRRDTVKVMTTAEKKDCPRIDQIRKIAFHSLSAKGPIYARSQTRKLVGNEEFCLQIDAHSKFVPHWDDKLRHQWAATQNEFGIISTVPLDISEYSEDTGVATTRQCAIQATDTLVPAYEPRADGKVENLKKPLLSHAWSARFSFSKCHLEEAAPYDPFMPYVAGVEQFVRFARFWTRGYDVYTPTENIIFHDFNPQPDGHGTSEWMENRVERHRRDSLARSRSILQLPDGDETLNLNNLGLYGLGKRRTMMQLQDFVGFDMKGQAALPSVKCADHHWIPYDANISPLANLFSEPDDLEPEPEFTLRTKLTFFLEEDKEMGRDLGMVGADSTTHKQAVDQPSPFPSFGTLSFFWVVGLLCWYVVFVHFPNQRFRKSDGNSLPRQRKPVNKRDD